MEEKLLDEIKQDFFRYRNGIVAESLKKLYTEDTLIFGLMVPQFKEIAKKYPKDLSLGLKLWENNRIRESRILSLYLFPLNEIDKSTAKSLFKDIISIEEADFLTFRVLRHLSFVHDLYEELIEENYSDELHLYCLEMLKRNLTANKQSNLTK